MFKESNKNPAIDIQELIKNDIKRLCQFQNLKYDSELSPEFLVYFINNVYWEAIPHYMGVCEDFVEKFYKYITDWTGYSRQNLSIDFIRKYKHKIDWFELLYANDYKISLEFVREFENYIDWDIFDYHLFFVYNKNCIRTNDKFVKEFSHRIDFSELLETIEYFSNESFISKEVKDYCRMFL
jgi:hypothetical protein